MTKLPMLILLLHQLLLSVVSAQNQTEASFNNITTTENEIQTTTSLYHLNVTEESLDNSTISPEKASNDYDEKIAENIPPTCHNLKVRIDKEFFNQFMSLKIPNNLIVLRTW